VVVGGSARRSEIPRWLVPAVGGWLVLVAVAAWTLTGEAAAPKVIWTAAVLVAALDIDVALVLHARHRRRAAARTAVHLPGHSEPLSLAD
jgi:hypothetical protein